MNYENKPHTGALFKNDKKSEKAPDYKGPFFDADGNEMQIAAWIRKSKAGKSYMSVMVTEKFVPKQKEEAKAPPAEDPDDDLPF